MGLVLIWFLLLLALLSTYFKRPFLFGWFCSFYCNCFRILTCCNNLRREAKQSAGNSYPNLICSYCSDLIFCCVWTIGFSINDIVFVCSVVSQLAHISLHQIFISLQEWTPKIFISPQDKLCAETEMYLIIFLKISCKSVLLMDAKHMWVTSLINTLQIISSSCLH